MYYHTVQSVCLHIFVNRKPALSPVLFKLFSNFCWKLEELCLFLHIVSAECLECKLLLQTEGAVFAYLCTHILNLGYTALPLVKESSGTIWRRKKNLTFASFFFFLSFFFHFHFFFYLFQCSRLGYFQSWHVQKYTQTQKFCYILSVNILVPDKSVESYNEAVTCDHVCKTEYRWKSWRISHCMFWHKYQCIHSFIHLFIHSFLLLWLFGSLVCIF